MAEDRTRSPWLDVDLADIAGEEWRTFASGKGYYQVSSLGRVKELATDKHPARILPQLTQRTSRLVSLKQLDANGVVQGRVASVKRLVVEAWALQKVANHVWTVANRVPQDNRLANIISVSRQELTTRLAAAGQGFQGGPRQPSRPARRAKGALVPTVENGLLELRTCARCNEQLPLVRFPTDTGERRFGNICTDCRNRAVGVEAAGRGRAVREQLPPSYRTCRGCQVEQPLDPLHFRPAFFGYSWTCFTCKQVPRSAIAQAPPDASSPAG